MFEAVAELEVLLGVKLESDRQCKWKRVLQSQQRLEYCAWLWWIRALLKRQSQNALRLRVNREQATSNLVPSYSF